MSASEPSIIDLPRSTAASLSPEDARTYYTWSNWFSAVAADPQGDTRQKYFHVRDLVNEEEDVKKIQSWTYDLFTSSPTVRFLADEIAKIGPPLQPHHVKPRRCPSITAAPISMPSDSHVGGQIPAQPSSQPMAIGGGFNLDYGILICANQMKSKSHLEDTLAHEMVHAWDHLKFQIQNNNMRHQACTEIRAATLSGECRITKEVWGRGQWKLVQQMQECVKRRAVLSMMERPQVVAKAQRGDGGRKEAERVVGEVWDSCFGDTRPFDEIFR